MLILKATYTAPKGAKKNDGSDDEADAPCVDQQDRNGFGGMMFISMGPAQQTVPKTKTMHIACRFVDAGMRKAASLLPKGGRIISVAVEYNAAEADDVTPEGFLAACREALNTRAETGMDPRVAEAFGAVVAMAKKPT